MEKQIWIVCAGCGNARGFTRQAAAAIRVADVRIGPPRLLGAVGAGPEHPQVEASSPEAIADAVRSWPGGRIAVLVPWTTGRGMGQRVLQALRPMKPTVIPGLAPEAYLAARCGADLTGAVSFCPDAEPKTLLMMLEEYGKVFSVSEMALNDQIRVLNDRGLGDAAAEAVFRPGDPRERIFRGLAKDLAGHLFIGETLLLLTSPEPAGRGRIGIPDRDLPDPTYMALPGEIRTLALGQLRIGRADVVYDIGCGHGALAVEAAALASDGAVYGIEQSAGAAEAAETLAGERGCGTLQVIHGTAPLALAHLPAPDRVLIEGTDGRIKEVLQIVRSRNPGVRVLVIRQTVEGASEALRLMDGMHFSPDLIEVNCTRSRKRGARHVLAPEAPYFLISGTHSSEKQ